MVQVSVNLLGLSVLPQQSSQDSLSSHPEDLGGHPTLSTTSTLSDTRMVSFTLGGKVESSSGPRMNLLLPLHDETVLDKFPDEDTGVGLTNLLDFIGIHPDSFSSALKHFGC